MAKETATARERRVVDAEWEFRAGEDGAPGTLVGYAALFGSMSDDLGGFREQIERGAFSQSLADGDDVRALFNHDPNFVLGRSKSGTLKLEENSKGLKVRIKMPPTSTARDLQELIRRGDISQMSFAFRTREDKWDREASIRTLLDVELFDVSPVTYPAYPETNVGVRSADLAVARAEFEACRARKRAQVAGARRRRVLALSAAK